MTLSTREPPVFAIEIVYRICEPDATGSGVSSTVMLTGLAGSANAAGAVIIATTVSIMTRERLISFFAITASIAARAQHTSGEEVIKIVGIGRAMMVHACDAFN